MCGRYGFSKHGAEKLGKAFGVGIDKEIRDMLGGNRQNHAPTMRGPVIRSGGQEIEMMRWGITSVPRIDVPARPLINARSETVASKPSFRDAWQHRRCLIAADYFYEWNQETPKGIPKQPWRFSVEDEELMVIAGIWSWATLDNGQKVEGYIVLTTDPAPMVAPVHDRMPVILHRRDWATWIDERTPVDVLKALQRPYDGRMSAVPVTKALNKASYQGPVEEVPLSVDPPAPKQGELF